MARIPKSTVVDTPQKVTLHLTGNGPAVKARQRIEQTIALVTAQALLDAGFLLGVNDGEDVTLHHSRDIEAVQQALFTTDEDYLYAYVEQGKRNDRPDAWVRLVYGNDGWEVICDYSADLDPFIGDGTVVQKLIDYASDNGVVPDLYLTEGKITLGARIALL